MKKFLPFLLAASFLAQTACANPVSLYDPVNKVYYDATNPLPVTSSGGGAATVTSVNGSVPAMATTVTLAATSSTITIWTSSDAANLYVSFTGAATTGKAIIYPGGSLTYKNGAPLSSFSILGASAAGTYNVIAF